MRCSSHGGLQELLDSRETYALEHDILFNTKKSAVMIRRCKLLKSAFVQPFTLNNEFLNEVQEAKYLGHFLTTDGKDERDMKRTTRSLYA